MPEFFNRPRTPSNPILVWMIACLVPLVTIKISIEIHPAKVFGLFRYKWPPSTSRCHTVLTNTFTHRSWLKFPVVAKGNENQVCTTRCQHGVIDNAGHQCCEPKVARMPPRQFFQDHQC